MKFNLSVVNGQALTVRRTVVGVGENLALPHGSTLLYSELVDDRGTDALEIWYAEPAASQPVELGHDDGLDLGTAPRVLDLPVAEQVELPQDDEDDFQEAPEQEDDDDYYY